MFLHSQKFTWWLSMVKKYLIRLNGAATQGFLNKCSKSHKILLLHELFSICFGFWLGTQTRKKCSSLSSALFLLPKTKLTSVTKLLNAFSLSLLQKQRTQRWTLKIIYCGVTNFSGDSLPEPLADPSASIYFNFSGQMRMSLQAQIHMIKGIIWQSLTIWQIIFFLSLFSSVLLNNGLFWITSCMAK